MALETKNQHQIIRKISITHIESTNMSMPHFISTTQIIICFSSICEEVIFNIIFHLREVKTYFLCTLEQFIFVSSEMGMFFCYSAESMVGHTNIQSEIIIKSAFYLKKLFFNLSQHSFWEKSSFYSTYQMCCVCHLHVIIHHK